MLISVFVETDILTNNVTGLMDENNIIMLKIIKEKDMESDISRLLDLN